MVRRVSFRRFVVPSPVFAAVLFLAAAASFGQPGPWVALGPPGGSVYCLVPDPTDAATLYAGTRHGVYKSVDGGETWTFSSVGLPDERVQTIAIDPTSSQTIYLGTITPVGVQSVGIFKSVDGAASWTPMNVGLVDPLTLAEPVDIETLAIDPSNPGTILAGSRFSEIFKSEDGAATWTPVTLGGSNVALEVSAFSYDPANPGAVLAASTQGLLLSTDAGDDWNFYGDAPIPFYCLARDPNNPAIIYAGNQGGSGIAKSSNNGANWLTANNDLPFDASGAFPVILGLTVDPANSSNVFAASYGNGAFRSVDAGGHWTPASAGMRTAFLTGIRPLPGSPTPIVATTSGGGVYVSRDSAGTWAEQSDGIVESQIAGLVFGPAPGRLFAGAFDGVHRTDDGGQTWQPMRNGLPVFPVTSLVFGPGATLLAGTSGGGLYQSVDAGVTWTNPAQGLADSYVSSLAADPSDASTIYAGTADPGSGATQSVYKSVDGGATWTKTALSAGSNTIDVLAVNPGNTSMIGAVTAGGTSYFQSTNGGGAWSTITPPTACGILLTILYESGGSTVDLGTTAGVCRSTDGGNTWTALPVAAGAAVQVLAISPLSPGTLYAGAAPAVPYEIGGVGGVFASSDGGQTWQAVGSGLSTMQVTALAFDPASYRIHAGLSSGGVATLSLEAPQRPSIDLPTPGSRTTHVVSRGPN
ncbi:MAG TPA: hypothetical protein VIA45_01415 [Thermoanaerobaculia bacterium]|jgi:photosystem II stability/assembly factor-like uncharacterized protein